MNDTKINPKAYISRSQIIEAFQKANAWGVNVYFLGDKVIDINEFGDVKLKSGGDFRLSVESDPRFLLQNNIILSALLLEKTPLPSRVDRFEKIPGFLIIEKVEILYEIIPARPELIFINRADILSIKASEYFDKKILRIKTGSENKSYLINASLEQIAWQLAN